MTKKTEWIKVTAVMTQEAHELYLLAREIIVSGLSNPPTNPAVLEGIVLEMMAADLLSGQTDLLDLLRSKYEPPVNTEVEDHQQAGADERSEKNGAGGCGA